MLKRIHMIKKIETGYLMRYDNGLLNQNNFYATNDLNSLIKKIIEIFEDKK